MQMTPTVEIFKSLRGDWQMTRSLKSEPGYGFSGQLDGTASFTPRKPTAHSVALELLYVENGQLTTDNGFIMSASRKYIYRYNADEDKISVWFVKEVTKDKSGHEEVDNLFMDVEIDRKGDLSVGNGEHLCSMDMYWAEYQWRHAADEEEDMQVWGLRYKVKGPQKDYLSNTAYQRVDA